MFIKHFFGNLCRTSNAFSKSKSAHSELLNNMKFNNISFSIADLTELDINERIIRWSKSVCILKCDTCTYHAKSACAYLILLAEKKSHGVRDNWAVLALGRLWPGLVIDRLAIFGLPNCQKNPWIILTKQRNITLRRSFLF